MNKVQWSRKAVKQLRKLSSPDIDSVVEATKALVDFPECRNVKRLTNHQYDYRLRVGRYRVMFDYDGEIKIISIEEVKKRDENTY